MSFTDAIYSVSSALLLLLHGAKTTEPSRVFGLLDKTSRDSMEA